MKAGEMAQVGSLHPKDDPYTKPSSNSYSRQYHPEHTDNTAPKTDPATSNPSEDSGYGSARPFRESGYRKTPSKSGGVVVHNHPIVLRDSKASTDSGFELMTVNTTAAVISGSRRKTKETNK